jgi:hypothetical protein
MLTHLSGLTETVGLMESYRIVTLRATFGPAQSKKCAVCGNDPSG